MLHVLLDSARPAKATTWLRLAAGPWVDWLALGVPALLGLWLRLLALNWSGALATPFGDELVAAGEASRLVADHRLLALRPNGALFYFVHALVLYAQSVLRTGLLNPRLVYDLPMFDRIVTGRAINVAFGLATIVVMVAIGRMVGGRRAGFWAGLAVAVSPSLVVETHFDATTASLVFWFALTIWLLLQAGRGRTRAAFLAPVAATAAFLTKPIGVIALGLVGLAGLWRLVETWRRTGRLPRYVLWSGALAALGGLALLAWRWAWLLRLVHDFLYTYALGTQPVYAWEWLWHYEGGLLLLGLVGLAASRVEPAVRWPLALTAGLYALGSLAFRVFFVRWLLPLLPVAGLFAGELLARWTAPGPARLRRGALTLLALALVTWMAGNAYALDHNLDTEIRNTLWTWLREHVPPGATIAMRDNWLPVDEPGQVYRILPLSEVSQDPAWYAAQGINYLVLPRGGLDYYNWRAGPNPVEPREQYPRLYAALDLEGVISGTILHIPPPIGADILRVPGVPVVADGQAVQANGWYAVERDPASGAAFRWMAGEGHVYYRRDGTGPAEQRLSFDAYVLFGQGEVSVVANGRPITHLALGEPGGPHHAEVTLPLAPGLNDIVLVSDDGCRRPIVADPSSADTRCLSLEVGRLAVEPSGISESRMAADTADSADQGSLR